MYICKNCFSTHELHSDQCPTCRMKGMIQQDNTISIKKETLKPKKHICPNCGTDDVGPAPKCKACNFPIKSYQPCQRGSELKKTS